MSLIENLSLEFPTSSDTNGAVWPQKMDNLGLKFQIHEVEGLYYLCSIMISSAPLFSHMQKKKDFSNGLDSLQ